MNIVQLSLFDGDFAPKKKCCRCLKIKPHLEFYKKTYKKGKQGQTASCLRAYCKACNGAMAAENQRKNAAARHGSHKESQPCKSCKEILPLSSFHDDRRAANGKAKHCRDCFSRRGENPSPAPVKALSPTVRSKKCSKCKQVKPASDFHTNKHQKTGLRSACKKCVTKRSKTQEYAPRKPRPIITTISVTEKTCTRCNQLKAADDFHRDSKHSTGLTPHCKQCAAKASLLYRSKPESKVRDVIHRRERQIQKLNATAKWADQSKIKWFYEESARLTRETGIQHSVDHIHPLRGKFICGLHVPANLQILTFSQNSRKSNKFIPYIESDLHPPAP